MTEAPDKIWATKSMAVQLNCQHKNVMGELATEYTRSDIADREVSILQTEVFSLEVIIKQLEARLEHKD